jgi:hypothetical protein
MMGEKKKKLQCGWWRLSIVRPLNWLVLIGSVFALVGSFIMVADQCCPPFSGLLNYLSAVGRVDEGWSKLKEFTYETVEGIPYGMLEQEDTGFEKILEIIRDNHPGTNESQMAAIIHTKPMSLQLGEGELPVITVISLLTQGESTPDAIATSEIVREWIARSRLGFVLFWGFLFVFVGFLVGLLGHLFQVTRKAVRV